MTDLDAAVLGAALAFAQRRLSGPLTDVGTDPAVLAGQVLGRALTGDEVTALASVAGPVAGHLTTAAQAATGLDDALGHGPSTLAEVAPASSLLCTVLKEVAAALAAVSGVVPAVPAGSGAVQALLRSAATAGPALTGVATPRPAAGW